MKKQLIAIIEDALFIIMWMMFVVYMKTGIWIFPSTRNSLFKDHAISTGFNTVEEMLEHDGWTGDY